MAMNCPSRSLSCVSTNRLNVTLLSSSAMNVARGMYAMSLPRRATMS